MGIRLRKAINFGPLRLNLSKSGVGFSIGTKKGYRFTRLADGRKRHTFFIPGTGLSYVKEQSASQKDKTGVADEESMMTLSWKHVGIIIGIIAIIIILAGYFMKQTGAEIDWTSVLKTIKKI